MEIVCKHLDEVEISSGTYSTVRVCVFSAGTVDVTLFSVWPGR